MRSGLTVLLVVTACGLPPSEEVASTSLQALAGGCTNPLDCPGGSDQPPPVDPHPLDCADVTGTLTASNLSPRLGAPVTFSWAVDASSCNEVLAFAGEPVSRIGSKTLEVTANSFAVTLGTRVVAQVNLTVVVPAVVRITGSSRVHRNIFLYAINTPNRVVLLQENVELDLTNLRQIPIAAGVSIASERLPATPSEALLPFFRGTGRNSNHLGPRLFTTNLVDAPLFVITGDFVALRGFRLEGPDQSVSDKLGVGVRMNRRRHIEIDNLEVSGWGRSGISVSNDAEHAGTPYELPPVVTTADDVRVHDCFIHNNQHAPGGFGYGVSVGSGARARITHNVFDFNRHSIASDGQPGSEYIARENLVLKGGGYHEAEWPGPNPDWTTHAFDAHGVDDCFGGDKNCGTAGRRYLVERNAFQYDQGYAFKLRGRPSLYAQVNDNVFAHPSESEAVGHTFGAPAPFTSGNLPGRDTFGQYGVCDFDGDGLDDLFLATGKTWWFASAGRFHWSYLDDKEDVLADLRFGDFDRDGKCDVFRAGPTGRWQVSSRGRGDWVPFAGANAFPLSALAFHDFDGDGFTDVFRRDGSGQWWVYDARTGSGRVINSSGVPMSGLRFGDFDNDGRTDVAAVVGGVWKWSRSGTTVWDLLNPHLDDLSDVIIGDFDDVPGDDVVRRIEEGPIDDVGTRSRVRYQLSAGAREPWVDLVTLESPWLYLRGELRVRPAAVLAGHFAKRPNDSLLSLALDTRNPKQFTAGQAGFVPHSFYAY